MSFDSLEAPQQAASAVREPGCAQTGSAPARMAERESVAAAMTSGPHGAFGTSSSDAGSAVLARSCREADEGLGVIVGWASAGSMRRVSAVQDPPRRLGRCSDRQPMGTLPPNPTAIRSFSPVIVSGRCSSRARSLLHGGGRASGPVGDRRGSNEETAR
jgi:hypothetical protein